MVHTEVVTLREGFSVPYARPDLANRVGQRLLVADVRDGACSSSTLKEAASWGKVQTTLEQMVFAEASTVIPLLASDAYHSEVWKDRPRREFEKLFAS